MGGDLLIYNIRVTLNFDFNEKVFYMLQAINQFIFFHLCNLASLGAYSRCHGAKAKVYWGRTANLSQI